MSLKDLDGSFELLKEMTPDQLDFLDSVSEVVDLAAEARLFEEDDAATSFYIIVSGTIGLELTAPGRPPIVIQTLGKGDIVGLSWLYPPYRWNWTARASVDTKLIAFDAEKVRAGCEADDELAHQVLHVVAKEALRRLHSTRTQLIDLYGPDSR